MLDFQILGEDLEHNMGGAVLIIFVPGKFLVT